MSNKVEAFLSIGKYYKFFILLAGLNGLKCNDAINLHENPRPPKPSKTSMIHHEVCSGVIPGMLMVWTNKMILFQLMTKPHDGSCSLMTLDKIQALYAVRCYQEGVVSYKPDSYNIELNCNTKTAIFGLFCCPSILFTWMCGCENWWVFVM